ncbi:hypothetical protein [Hymenobacter negativus]|uniref:Lipoprotein n=1 Tax=Hymenobacter negativus TaxID=2795026 RepID=A0ABS3QNL8_9BACT|nr:hypothetical protein [Hymenobacter negativus]MBO2012697.1 hypothetical protein [Hymenobacter negativus]
MLKYLLLVALCAASCTPVEQKAEPAEQTACVKQISITHIGIQDKSITGLIVTTSSTLRLVDTENMAFVPAVVSQDEFTRVAYLLNTFDSSMQSDFPKLEDMDYGTFRVKVFDACKQVSDNSYQPKRSAELFKFLLKNIKSFGPKNQQLVERQLNDLYMCAAEGAHYAEPNARR